MAAAMGSGCEAPVRLRLLFDYPPPVTPACGLCWLLVEPNQVRFITDLISLIREKFGFSRHARLNLFLDGGLLPPTESARLVRDNDCLRVKLEEIVGLNSYDTVTNGSSSLSKKQRKQQKKLEAKDSESEDEEPNKRKKSKWNFEQKEEKSTNIQDSVTLGKKKKAAPERSDMMDTESEDDNSHSKKPRKKLVQGKEQDAKKEKKKKASTCPSKSTSQKTEKSFSQKSTKGNTTAQSNPKKGSSSSESSTSSSDSDHSTPGTKQTNTHASKGTSQHMSKPQLASLKSLSTGKYKDKISLKIGETKKAKNQSSSSDSDSSSEEEQQSSDLRNKLPYQKQAAVTGHSSKTQPKSSSSESDDSAESETDALKKQKANAIDNLSVRGNDRQPSDVSYGLASNLKENRRGRGRGETPLWRGPRVRGCRGMTRGRGERVHFFYNYSSENQKQKQLNEAATNASVIIQLLELTENYTPEVSDYKEGKIVSWNPVNKQLELEILSFSSVAKEPGKFDLVYQSEDGDETIEYAVSQDRKITQSWEALIEPRLIIDSPTNESGPQKEIPSNVNLPDPQMLIQCA
ncbi:coilin isoform 2-T2 [Vipera latastei]